MLATVDFTAELRTEFGKERTKKIRTAGDIPAVIYGKSQENIHIRLNRIKFTKTLKTSSGKNLFYNMDLGEQKVQVVIREMQKSVLKDYITHVDFVAIHESIPITVEIPVHLKGTSTGVKRGGLLNQKVKKLRLSVLPNEIMTEFEIDVTDLDIGQFVKVSELKLPASAKVLYPSGDQRVVTVDITRATDLTETAAESAAAEAASAASTLAAEAKKVDSKK